MKRYYYGLVTMVGLDQSPAHHFRCLARPTWARTSIEVGGKQQFNWQRSVTARDTGCRGRQHSSGFFLAARASSASDKTSVACNELDALFPLIDTDEHRVRFFLCSVPLDGVGRCSASSCSLAKKPCILYSILSESGGRLTRSRFSTWVYKLWHQYHL